jgi:hypothetical protein
MGYTIEGTARASAALPAAGAFDTTPTVLESSEYETVTFFCKYTRGAAGGKTKLRVDVSPESSGSNWYQASALAVGTVASGSDNASLIQRDGVEYGSTGAAAEMFVYGPIRIDNASRTRIAAAESGVVGTPGTLEILARFS